MSTPFPNPATFASDAEYGVAREAWDERLRTDGQRSVGNCIGMTPIGPFPSVAAGDTLKVTFALVAAVKPEEFQGQPGKAIDDDASRSLLANNIGWARRTYAGEDNNFNGRLDLDEDVNGNGVLDRYLIPEPPASPKVHVAFERDVDGASAVAVYWDKGSRAFPRSSELGKKILKDIESTEVIPVMIGRGIFWMQQRSLLSMIRRETGPDSTTDSRGSSLMSPNISSQIPPAYWYRFEARDLKSGWQYLFFSDCN